MGKKTRAGDSPGHTSPEDGSRSAVIASILGSLWLDCVDENGAALEGIRGRRGARGLALDDVELGADLIEMQPGSHFPLHTHVGAHILYAIEGAGSLQVNGSIQPMRPGDTAFIPASLPHAVVTSPSADEPFLFLAVGIPHLPVDSRARMQVVQES